MIENLRHGHRDKAGLSWWRWRGDTFPWKECWLGTPLKERCVQYVFFIGCSEGEHGDVLNRLLSNRRKFQDFFSLSRNQLKQYTTFEKPLEDDLTVSVWANWCDSPDE